MFSVGQCFVQLSHSFHHLFPHTDTETFNKAVFCFSSLILLITFSTPTQKCSAEGTVHSLTTYFSSYTFFPHTQRSFNRRSACSVAAWVCVYICVESSNFLSHFLKYSTSLQFRFSSLLFFYTTHTHTHSYLHFPPIYTHSNIHTQISSPRYVNFPWIHFFHFYIHHHPFLLPTYHNFRLRDM